MDEYKRRHSCTAVTTGPTLFVVFVLPSLISKARMVPSARKFGKVAKNCRCEFADNGLHKTLLLSLMNSMARFVSWLNQSILPNAAEQANGLAVKE